MSLRCETPQLRQARAAQVIERFPSSAPVLLAASAVLPLHERLQLLLTHRQAVDASDAAIPDLIAATAVLHLFAGDTEASRAVAATSHEQHAQLCLAAIAAASGTDAALTSAKDLIVAAIRGCQAAHLPAAALWLRFARLRMQLGGPHQASAALERAMIRIGPQSAMPKQNSNVNSNADSNRVGGDSLWGGDAVFRMAAAVELERSRVAAAKDILSAGLKLWPDSDRLHSFTLLHGLRATVSTLEAHTRTLPSGPLTRAVEALGWSASAGLVTPTTGSPTAVNQVQHLLDDFCSAPRKMPFCSDAETEDALLFAVFLTIALEPGAISLDARAAASLALLPPSPSYVLKMSTADLLAEGKRIAGLK
jgi:hypothetical protein